MSEKELQEAGFMAIEDHFGQVNTWERAIKLYADNYEV